MSVSKTRTSNPFIFSIFIFMGIVLPAYASADWQYEENYDPMTDENKSMAAITIGRDESAAVRCNGSDNYEIIFSVGQYLNDAPRIPVQFRIDDKEPSEVRTWSLSTNGMAVFAPLRYKKELIDGLKSGNQITVRITDYQGSRPYSTFSLSGSSAAIGQLACVP